MCFGLVGIDLLNVFEWFWVRFDFIFNNIVGGVGGWGRWERYYIFWVSFF